jgi:hypothetical protein
MPPHPTSWRSILISFSSLRLGLQIGLLPSGLPTKTLYEPLLSLTRATFPAHLIHLDFIAPNNIWGGVRIIKLLVMWSSPFSCCLILLITIFSAYVLSSLWETMPKPIKRTKLHFSVYYSSPKQHEISHMKMRVSEKLRTRYNIPYPDFKVFGTAGRHANTWSICKLYTSNTKDRQWIQFYATPPSLHILLRPILTSCHLAGLLGYAVSKNMSMLSCFPRPTYSLRSLI